MRVRRVWAGLWFACVACVALPAFGCGDKGNDAGTMTMPNGSGMGGANGGPVGAGTSAAGTGAAGTNAPLAGTSAGAGAGVTAGAGTAGAAAGAGAAGSGGSLLSPPPELAPGVAPPYAPDGTRIVVADAADTWVSYGNGPSNWFANLGERRLGPGNADHLEMKWKIDSEVTSPPVVVGDRVYVTTAEDGLFALDLETGAVIWRDETVSSFSAPAYDPATDRLYVNRWEGGVMHAFDAADGNLRWSMPLDEQDAVRGWSSPVIAGRRLLVGIASSDRGTTFKGGLASFDLDAETREWAYIHAEPQAAGVAIWAGPSIDPSANIAFAASGNNYTLAGAHSDSLFGVDLGTADLLWNQQTEANDRWAYDCILCGPDHDFGTNPVLIDYEDRELLVAGQKSGSFWMLDRTTGEILWEKVVATVSHPAYGGVLNNGAFDGQRLLVAGNQGASPGTLYAIDPDPNAGGRVIWERPLDGLVVAPITVANGLAFVAVGMNMEVIATEDGETVAVLAADAPVAGAAAVAQGHVFFGSGLSYYDNGAQPGSFYAYGLGADAGAASPGGPTNPGAGAGGSGGPTTGHSFTRVFNEVITGTGCNGGPLCHGGAVGGLLMADKAATYAALVGVAAMGTNTADAQNADCVDTGIVRVVPGDPDASLLVQKIDPNLGEVPCGALMPPTGVLDRAHIDLVRDWIAAGAPND